MGPAIYIPRSWFGPLPDWMVPWVVAASILVFGYVALWAIWQRRDSPVHLAPDGRGTVHPEGKVGWPTLVLVGLLGLAVILLWLLDPLGSPPPP